MKNSIIWAIIVILSNLIGCSKSNDGRNDPPEFSDAQIAFETTFYEEGEIAPPKTDWHGDTGSYGLENAIRGVSIHPTSGIVTWDKTLPLGINHITVLAFNDRGITRATLLLENRFVGKFQGFFDIIVSINGVPAPETFCFELNGTTTFVPILDNPYEGSWTIFQNDLEAKYPPRENLGRPFVLEAKVTYNEETAYIVGRYGKDLDDPEKSSAFRMDLVEEE